MKLSANSSTDRYAATKRKEKKFPCEAICNFFNWSGRCNQKKREKRAPLAWSNLQLLQLIGTLQPNKQSSLRPDRISYVQSTTSRPHNPTTPILPLIWTPATPTGPAISSLTSIAEHAPPCRISSYSGMLPTAPATLTTSAQNPCKPANKFFLPFYSFERSRAVILFTQLH